MIPYEKWISGDYMCINTTGFCTVGKIYRLVKSPSFRANMWEVKEYTYYFNAKEVQHYFEPAHVRFNDTLDELLK